MQTLMIDFIVSLDGYGAADGWPGFWGLEGPEYLAWLGEQEEHTALLGANTYRLMSGFGGDEDGMAELIAQPKVVFSSTLTEPLTWPHTRLIAGDPVAAVRELKATSPLPLRTLGSLTLARTLLRAGLVDRFRVVVFPVITGTTGQDRIYDGYPDVRLDLVGSRLFDGRLQLLDYTPTVLDT
jgi:dihydrofolate reductase